MSRALPAAVLALAVAGLAGCGRTGAEAEVRSATTSFLAALGDGDGTRACAQLSADTAAAIADHGGAACAHAVTELTVEGGAIRRVQVYVGNAKVDLASGESVFLSDEGGDWRLSAVGCRPQGGKPADRPYECEAQP